MSVCVVVVSVHLAGVLVSEDDATSTVSIPGISPSTRAGMIRSTNDSSMSISVSSVHAVIVLNDLMVFQSVPFKQRPRLHPNSQSVVFTFLSASFSAGIVAELSSS